MIDTHAHLTDERYGGDVTEVLERSKESGVEAIINPSTTLADARLVDRLTRTYPQVYGLVGLYPGEAKKESWQSELKEMRELLSNNKKIVGIGEIGLDETPLKINPDLEYEVFETQLKYALDNDYPVVIHTRNTEREMWEVFKRYSRLPRGHMHCFSGSIEWLEYVLERGFYVGFDGNVTYKNAENLRELARRVPGSRLLLETDSPYLPPAGRRGERNEPGNVRITAEFLANLRGESCQALVEMTSHNARELYKL
ncbi:MAG: TatD family deoxyribonuclease [Candidatus Moraniibacteriota bacterium]|nr:MAG: TatD family deoxyribonuclease [Candidatus Moranbacteria bacterium]